MVLLLALVRRNRVRHVGHVQQCRQIKAPRLPVPYRLRGVKPVHPSYHLIDSPEPHLSHDLAEVLCHEEKVVDQVFRPTGELLPKFRVLCCNAHRASIQVALAQHDAPQRYERRCRQPELLRPEQAGNRHVPAGLDLAVRLNDDTASQVVHHQNLLCLRNAELPRETGVLYR